MARAYRALRVSRSLAVWRWLRTCGEAGSLLRRVRFVALILAAAAPGLALSAIVPSAQNRSIDAYAIAAVAGGTPDIEDDQASATAYAPFAAQVQPKATAVGGTSFAIAQGAASQSSSIGSNGVVAEGTASLLLTVPSSGAGASAAAGGDSSFELTFIVDVLSSFSLSGAVDTQAIVSGGATLPTLDNAVWLEDLDQAFVLFTTLTDDQTFSVSGWLNPGTTYRLRASASTGANQASSNTLDRTVSGLTSFDLDLQLVPQAVPEPATAFLVAGGAAVVLVGRRRRRCGATDHKRRRCRTLHVCRALASRFRPLRAERSRRTGSSNAICPSAIGAESGRWGRRGDGASATALTNGI